ncbi:MAG: hypothetical protein HW421_3608 [Ignavibacteria bacterium]|nr:hypothetical protein [Ignavibacteria bacterium]
MDREEHNENYYKIKSQLGLKEYIFLTPAGYRHFFILGKDLKDAEENFMRMDVMDRNGFSLDDLPIRLEYDEEKCKDWKKDQYWKNNENMEYVNRHKKTNPV